MSLLVFSRGMKSSAGSKTADGYCTEYDK